MAHTRTRDASDSERLTETQWLDLMRSLIEDVDVPRDEDTENSTLREVAGHNHADSWQ